MTFAGFVRGLRDCLRWEGNEFSAGIRDVYHRHLTEKANGFLKALDGVDPPTAQVARLLWETLTPGQRLDFISLPHIASLVLWQDALVQPARRNFFLKTLGVSAGCISDDDPMNNLCAVMIPAPAPSPPFSAEFPESYRVSFSGELPIPFMDRGGNKLLPVSPEDAHLILVKLEAAGRLIRDINPNTSVFSTGNTALLGFRYESEDPRDFSSGSFQTLPGFSLICNCHLASVREPELADAIVHEAIHAIIYRFEAAVRPLIKAEEMKSLRIVSPWTGARLSVESFAQACLVWFGLHHFWKGARGDDGESRALFERATKGFLSASYSASCRAGAGCLSPGVATELEELRNYL